MGGSSAGSLRWVIGLPIFIAFTCCLTLNAASQLLEDSNPSFAAALNPLNTDARVNVLVAKLNSSEVSLDEVSSDAEALVALSRADARGYSLVGAIMERRGDTAAARAAYALALDHSRTERYALTRMLSLSLEDGDVATATRYFDLLLRRWGEFAKEIAPLAHDFIAKPEGAEALKRALEKYPPWRGPVVLELLLSPMGMRFVSGVLVSSDKRTGAWRNDLVNTINRQIWSGVPGEAYALFQQTLTPEEATVAGYVYDPGFTRSPGRRAFEWSAIASSSVDASFPASSTAAGLRIRFLDSPAKLGRPSQALFLPPGEYKLATTASGMALTLPKALFWQVTCDGRKELVRLQLPEGTYTTNTQAATFTVSSSCISQTLTLETGVVTSSWRDRYGGEILITDVHVSRAGGGA